MEGYTIKEASQELRVCQKTVHNYILRGVLKAEKEYGRWIIDPESFRTLKERKGIGDTSAAALGNRMIVDKSHYEALLKQIGQFQGKEELFAEFKDAIEDLRRRVEKLERIFKEKQRKGVWKTLLRKSSEREQNG